MFHTSSKCLHSIEIILPIIKKQFSLQDVNLLSHELKNEHVSRQNFEEEIEQDCHRKVCEIISKEIIYQSVDYIITISDGIKQIDEKYYLIFGIMLYHKEKFYYQESEPIEIPLQYYHLINKSQLDRSIFLDNFILNKLELFGWINDILGVYLDQILSNTIGILLNKLA